MPWYHISQAQYDEQRRLRQADSVRIGSDFNPNLAVADLFSEFGQIVVFCVSWSNFPKFIVKLPECIFAHSEQVNQSVFYFSSQRD